MMIFHSYVKLPEGTRQKKTDFSTWVMLHDASNQAHIDTMSWSQCFKSLRTTNEQVAVCLHLPWFLFKAVKIGPMAWDVWGTQNAKVCFPPFGPILSYVGRIANIWCKISISMILWELICHWSRSLSLDRYMNHQAGYFCDCMRSPPLQTWFILRLSQELKNTRNIKRHETHMDDKAWLHAGML